MNAPASLPALIDMDMAGPTFHVYPEGATKGDIIFDLSSKIPRNEFGLPIFFLRSDFIHGTQIAEDALDAATVNLYYFEGYPTLENGSSFWNQLPHEPQLKYELFQKFLDQPEDIGIRQLDQLAVTCKPTVNELNDMSREFFWTSRARAYDMFIVAAEAKKRQHRIRKMENKHFNLADKLMEALQARFEGEFNDWMEELNAKEAIEVLSELHKIQRASVGLVGQHASSTSRQFADGESSESMIRHLAQGAGASNDTTDRFAAQLKSLLDNPEEGATIQAAILKFTAPNNRQQFDEGV